MLKNRTTYEIMNPQDVGWEGTKLVVGQALRPGGLPERAARNSASSSTTSRCRRLPAVPGAGRPQEARHRSRPDALVSDQLETEGERLSPARSGRSISPAASRRPPRSLLRHGEQDRRRCRRATARSMRSSRRSTPRQDSNRARVLPCRGGHPGRGRAGPGARAHPDGRQDLHRSRSGHRYRRSQRTGLSRGAEPTRTGHAIDRDRRIVNLALDLTLDSESEQNVRHRVLTSLDDSGVNATRKR